MHDIAWMIGNVIVLQGKVENQSSSPQVGNTEGRGRVEMRAEYIMTWLAFVATDFL